MALYIRFVSLSVSLEMISNAERLCYFIKIAVNIVYLARTSVEQTNVKKRKLINVLHDCLFLLLLFIVHMHKFVEAYISSKADFISM